MRMTDRLRRHSFTQWLGSPVLLWLTMCEAVHWKVKTHPAYQRGEVRR